MAEEHKARPAEGANEGSSGRAKERRAAKETPTVREAKSRAARPSEGEQVAKDASERQGGSKAADASEVPRASVSAKRDEGARTSEKQEAGDPRKRTGRKREAVHDGGESPRTPRSVRKRRRWPIAALVAVIAVVACAVAFAMPASRTFIEPETLSVSDVSQAPSTDEERLQNPIDFDALRQQNPDIYAWIYVPGTQVNLPILQSPMADNYYLYHNVDREDDPVGAPYTQSQNSKDFTDPVTVVYGHTFQPDDERADEAFGTLHDYEDKAFFDEHPLFYIYTPTKMFTYKVVSAYETDNSHILNTRDLSDPAVLQHYLDLVVNPEDADANVGSIQELEAGAAYIVQLSTCTRPSVSEKRFLVTGVMVGEHNYETVTRIERA